MNFNEMNLIEPLLNAVQEVGYESPTPIQQATIPLVLDGKDVLGCAQTGTGKTAAFALPILQKLTENPPKQPKKDPRKRPIRALILTPTRELALQIFENFEAYSKNLEISNCVIFGGVGQNPQVEKLKNGVDVLIATPGRLNDLMGQGHIRLDKIEIFVLDEADRMLDMGFIHDVRKVIKKLPQKRQTLFFSATMPPDVEDLAVSILQDPASVKVDPPSSTVDMIRQSIYFVDRKNKRKLLSWLVEQPGVFNALVFTRTKHGADRVAKDLVRDGIPALAIHGDKSQSARQNALKKFKSGDLKVLVATDIAARGIDISVLTHVINYELPEEAETYVHRIGRTGRAGCDGDAMSLCCYDEFDHLRNIEKLIGKTIPEAQSPWPMEVFTSSPEKPKPQRKPGNFRGGRNPGRNRR